MGHLLPHKAPLLFLLLSLLIVLSTCECMMRREALFGTCGSGTLASGYTQKDEVIAKNFLVRAHDGGVVLPNEDILFQDDNYLKLFNHTSGTVRRVQLVWEDDPTQTPFYNVISGVKFCKNQIIYDRTRSVFYLLCAEAIKEVKGKAVATIASLPPFTAAPACANAPMSLTKIYAAEIAYLTEDGKYLYVRGGSNDILMKMNLETRMVDRCASGKFDSTSTLVSFVVIDDTVIYGIRPTELRFYNNFGTTSTFLMPISGGVKLERGPDTNTLYYCNDTALFSINLAGLNSTLLASGFTKIQDFTVYKNYFFINDQGNIKIFDGTTTTLVVQNNSTLPAMIDHTDGISSINMGAFKMAAVNETYLVITSLSNLRSINLATRQSFVMFTDIASVQEYGSSVLSSGAYRDMTADDNGNVYTHGFCLSTRKCTKFLKLTPTMINGQGGYSISVIGGSGNDSDVDGPRATQSLTFSHPITFKMALKYPDLYFSSLIGIRKFNIPSQVITTVLPLNSTAPVDGPIASATCESVGALAFDKNELLFIDDGKLRVFNLNTNMVTTLPTPQSFGNVPFLSAMENTLYVGLSNLILYSQVMVYYNRSTYFIQGCGSTVGGCEFPVNYGGTGLMHIASRNNVTYLHFDSCVEKLIPAVPDTPTVEAVVTRDSITLEIAEIPKQWNGLTLEYMEISYKPVLDCGTKAWVDARVPFATSYSITGLTSGTTYTICVSFKNFAGTSDLNCITAKTKY